MIAEDSRDTPEARVRRADLKPGLGHALKTEGLTAEAIDAYIAATADRPDFGDAWWSLANLKTYRFSAESIAILKATARSSDDCRMSIDIHVAFALGKALEDLRRLRRLGTAYSRGNTMHRASNGYVPEVFETNTREQKRRVHPGVLRRARGLGDRGRLPIFVLGLPRAVYAHRADPCLALDASKARRSCPISSASCQRIAGPRVSHFDKPLYPGIACRARCRRPRAASASSTSPTPCPTAWLCAARSSSTRCRTISAMSA